MIPAMSPGEITPDSRTAAESHGPCTESVAQQGTLRPPVGRLLLRAAGFSAFLFAGWMLLAGWFHPSLASLQGPQASPTLLLSYYVCLDGFALALSALFLRAADGRSFRALGLWFFPRWWLPAAAGVAAGALPIALVALVAAEWNGSGFIAPASADRNLPSLLAFFLLAAAFEELMFRGYAWQSLSDALGPLSASLVSSLLFGLAHANNPQAGLLSLGNTVLAGALMCAARWRSRALWMPLGLHFAWNVFLGPVFGYPVSGLPLSGGAALVSGKAPDWVTGGGYGLEASAVLTVVAAGAILLVTRCPLKWLSPFGVQE